MARARYGALVLAAGESRRMGTPKAALQLTGRPLLEAHIEAFLAADLQPVVVVLGHEARSLLATLDLAAAHPVINENYHAGQFSSVRAGLTAFKAEEGPASSRSQLTEPLPAPQQGQRPSEIHLEPSSPTRVAGLSPLDGVFLTPVDCPPVPLELLRQLRSTHERIRAGAVVPTCQGQPGHPVVLGQEAIRAVLEASADSNLEAVLSGLGAQVYRIETAQNAVLWNLNRPADVALYLSSSR